MPSTANRITDIPIDGMSNPGEFVQSVKRCEGCNYLMWWNHLPGRPEEYEPPQDQCSKCAPDSYPSVARVAAMWNPFVTDELYV